MTTAQQHVEAIRAAFRQYDLTEFLTSDMYTLVKDLHLVDVNKNEIRCMGKCVNGGKCSQKVNEPDVIRGIMGLSLATFASNQNFQNNLVGACQRLLCLTSKHRTDAQAFRLVDEVNRVVTRLRNSHQHPVPGPSTPMAYAVATTSPPSLVTAGTGLMSKHDDMKRKETKAKLHLVEQQVAELSKVVKMLQMKSEKLEDIAMDKVNQVPHHLARWSEADIYQNSQKTKAECVAASAAGADRQGSKSLPTSLKKSGYDCSDKHTSRICRGNSEHKTAVKDKQPQMSMLSSPMMNMHFPSNLDWTTNQHRESRDVGFAQVDDRSANSDEEEWVVTPDSSIILDGMARDSQQQVAGEPDEDRDSEDEEEWEPLVAPPRTGRCVVV